MAENKKIILSGGGTGGSVTTILAIAGKMNEDVKNLEFLFIGTEFGPEKEMVAAFNGINIPFISIPAGKWRRYFSFNNFLDIFNILSAFFKSLKIIKKEKPNLIITSGSFASVPLVYAARCKKIPVLIHQQDIRPGLANKLMAPFAQAITVSFEKSLVDYGPKAILTGNPVLIPNNLSWPEELPESFNNNDKPLILFTGGGTGALFLNDLVIKAKEELLKKTRIIHLSGKGKIMEAKSEGDYAVFEFLDNKKILAIMKRADIVVSRCGLGALTELAVLKKASILIPMPNSHQEDNADVFSRSESAIVLNQNSLDDKILTEVIFDLLADKEKREKLSKNIGYIMKRDAAERIAGIAFEMIK